MKRKATIIIFLSLATMILVSIVVAYRIWNKPHPDIRNAVAVKISAKNLYDILSDNRSSLKTTFVNKVVSVTGTVKKIVGNLDKQQVVLLQTNVDGASVNCTMEQRVEGIKAGDVITLKGWCLGYSGGDVSMNLPGDVFLIRCYGL